MKSMRWLLIVLAVLVAPATGWALNEWTVLLYIVNDDKDTTMENANMRSIQAMTRSGPPAGCEIVVIDDLAPKAGSPFGGIFGGNKESGASIYTVQKGSVNVEDKLGEVNMGSPYVLWSFLKKAAERHPARNYALIINSHGSGIFSWRGTGGTSSMKPGAVDFDPDSRFVAYDHTDNDCLTVFEIVAVLDAFKTRLNRNRPLSVLAFDACLPGSIEAVYQFRNSCEVMVGAADTTGINGYPYARIMSAVDAERPANAAGFAKAMVSGAGMRDMGYWNVARGAELTFAFNAFVLELMNASADGYRFDPSEAYGGKNYCWDIEASLGSMGGLSGVKNGALVRKTAEEALAAVTACRTVSSGAGISVAMPTPDDYRRFRSFYKALDFARDTQWDEYLDKVYDVR
ncbi:MAG: Clostripain precursor [bacterium ADurb.Bin374]|nr:MAG: Clostripain precursor [bacterium ADurb.Bin374]